MHYRRFGRTGLNMPVISTGGMRYQQGWKDVPLSEIEADKQANLEACIRRSLDAGINHIETARGYGPSERQLGQILPTYPRDELIVQTKVGPADDGDKFIEDFEDSLQRLQLDHVDLLGLHGLNAREPLDRALGPKGCLAAARKLQKQGKCRWVGFSTHGTLDIILEAINTDEEYEGVRGFDYVNLHWYYIFQHNWPAIEAATKQDMGVFIISPSDKGGKLYDPPQKLVELCDPLHPIVFNDLWCLLREQVHTLSLGAAKPSDYDLHLEAAQLLPRAAELVPPIERRLEEAMREATGEVSPEAGVWTLPDHRAAPAELNLPIMLWLYNVARGWGMTEYGKMRFNMLGNGGHWFPGAKADAVAQVDDAALTDAAGDSPLAPQLPTLLRDAADLLGGEEVKRLSQS